MPKALLIAEKPSLMRDIQEAYNKMGHPDTITFKSFVGHTMGLQMPADYTPAWKNRKMSNLPMVPKQFVYQPSKDKLDIYADLKKEITSGKYDYIINACDPGREGQHIFFSFYDSLGINIPVKRIWHADVTTGELSRALNNLLDEKSLRLTHMTQASKLRAFFDWLVGMNYSSAFSLVSGKNISVGRVMSPTLKIIVDRELEITKFVSKPFWNVESDFGDYKGMYNDKSGEGKFDKKTEAEDFISSLGNTGIVKSVDEKKVSKSAPMLFSLQTLSTESSKAFGYSMSETLKITQALYEKKLVSYPRTDSSHLTSAISKEFLKMLKPLTAIPELKGQTEAVMKDSAIISKVQGNKMYVDDKKVSDHYAITPTRMTPDMGKLNKKEQNIYTLIAKRFLAIFLPPLVTIKTRIVTDIDGKDFITTGSVLVSKGFTDLYGYNPKDAVLPKVKKGESFKVKKFNLIEKKTSPPARYTDGTLGQAMENAGKFVDDKDMKSVLKEAKGIGTPATRGGIVDKLVTKDMIGYQKKVIYATDYGISLIESLNNHDVTSVVMTAEWEMKLRDVEDGILDANSFYTEMVTYITKSTEDIKKMTIHVKGSTSSSKSSSASEEIGKCPKCGGIVKDGKNYYMCEHYKGTCDFIFGKKQWSANVTKTEAKKILNGKPSKVLKFDNGKKKWEGQLIFDKAKGKVVSYFPTPGPSSTSSASKSDMKTADGKPILEDRFNFYNSDKSIKISKSIWGVTITLNDVKALLSGKELSAREFTWSSGQKSKAKLYLDKNSKVCYNFK